MPNKNSYLTVGLSEEARAQLYLTAMACHAAAFEHGCGFDPMAYDGLHVTFFFMGEALRALDARQVDQFHQKVAQAVCEANLSVQTMRFESLDLFPPGKSNLIVAKFAVGDALRALQCRVVEIARGFQIGGSRSERQRLYGEQSWCPHCTLGKLRGSAETVAIGGTRMIQQLECHLQGVTATGLLMGGEIPRQKWVDWEGTLQFQPDHEETGHEAAYGEESPGGPTAELTDNPAAGALRTGEPLVYSCVGSTSAIQSGTLGSTELKRSVSWYLGPGSSAAVQEVAEIHEDEEPAHQPPSTTQPP